MAKKLKKELIGTLMFSLAASIALIIHGIFFDLDFSQIKRLSIGGFIFTFVLTFLGLRLLERIFTLDENEAISEIKTRLNKLEKKK